MKGKLSLVSNEELISKYKAVVALAKELRECTAHGFECSKTLWPWGCNCGLSDLIKRFDVAVAALTA